MKLTLEVSEETFNALRNCARVYSSGNVEAYVLEAIEAAINNDQWDVIATAKMLGKSSGAVTYDDVVRKVESEQ